MDRPKEFKMSRLVKHKDGRTEVKWLTEKGEDTSKRKQPPHQDFDKAVSKIEGFLAQYYELNEDRVTLKSITVKDWEDDKGASVTIKGSYTHPDSEQVTPISTASIPVHLDHYKFEKDLKNKIHKLSKEAEAWVFDFKSAQATMKLEPAAAS